MVVLANRGTRSKSGGAAGVVGVAGGAEAGTDAPAAAFRRSVVATIDDDASTVSVVGL